MTSNSLDSDLPISSFDQTIPDHLSENKTDTQEIIEFINENIDSILS